MTFKDVEHLYLGCKLQYPDGEIHRLVGVAIDGYEFDESSFLNARVTDDSKPILRRLEDLTEEHAREFWPELWSGIFYRYEDAFEKAGSKGYTHIDKTPYGAIDIGVRQLSSFDSLIGRSSVWFRLLKYGYDLFGLIEAGQAIDAKTLEAQL